MHLGGLVTSALEISNPTNGTTVTRATAATDAEGDPTPENKRYSNGDPWGGGGIHASFKDHLQIATSATGGGVSFTANQACQVSVWWPNAQTLPSWLDSTWTDSGEKTEGDAITAYYKVYGPDRATNLLTESEDLAASPWANNWGNGVTYTANDTSAPDGTTTADKLEQSAAAGDGVATSSVNYNTSVAHVKSLYLKNDDAVQSKLTVWDTTDGSELCTLSVNWSSGVPSKGAQTGSPTQITFVDAVNDYPALGANSGWWRVAFRFTTASTAGHRFVIAPEVNGSNGNGVWAWGVLVTEGDELRSYVKTAGATANGEPETPVFLDSASYAYDVFIRPGNKSVGLVGAVAGSAGLIQFKTSSTPMDDTDGSTAITIERVDGSVGVATCTASCPDTFGVLDANGGDAVSDVVTWADADVADKTITYNPSPQTANKVETITIGTFTGASEGGQSTHSVLITDVGTTPTAQTHWVAVAAAGAGDGTTEANAAKAETFAPTVQPVAGGDVAVKWATGTYSFVLSPSNSGDDTTHRVIHQPHNGDVTFDVDSTDGFAFKWGGKQWVDFVRASTHDVIVSGGGTAVKSGGVTGETVKKVCDFEGASNCVLEITSTKTEGWDGYDNFGDHITLRPKSDQQGNSWWDADSDAGDLLKFDPTNGTDLTDASVADALLIEGPDDGLHIEKSGHSAGHIVEGTGICRHMMYDGDWSAVSGYEAGCGNRPGTIVTRESQYFVTDDCIFRTTGQSADRTATLNIGMKLEGINNALTRSFFFDTAGKTIKADVSSHSHQGRGMRVAHVTGYDVSNASSSKGFIEFRDTGNGRNLFTDPETSVYMQDVKIYNVLVESFGGTFFLRFKWDNNGGNWEDHLEIKNCVLPTGCDLIKFDGDISNLGTMSIAAAEAAYPANFSGNINANSLLSAPAVSGTDFSNVYTRFVPTGAALNGGADLTTANGSGSSSDQLIVNDSTWFQVPHSFPTPADGPDAGQYTINLNGTNVGYTALNQTTKTFTLASATSWSSGDSVNLRYSTSPNIGAV